MIAISYPKKSSSEAAAHPLVRHMSECARARGRWFRVGCLVEHLHAFIVPRFFTTVFITTGVLGLMVVWT